MNFGCDPSHTYQSVDPALCLNHDRVKCLNCGAILADTAAWTNHQCPYALTIKGPTS